MTPKQIIGTHINRSIIITHRYKEPQPYCSEIRLVTYWHPLPPSASWIKHRCRLSLNTALLDFPQDTSFYCSLDKHAGGCKSRTKPQIPIQSTYGPMWPGWPPGWPMCGPPGPILLPAEQKKHRVLTWGTVYRTVEPLNIMGTTINAVFDVGNDITPFEIKLTHNTQHAILWKLETTM